jgi:hypothetical protein
MVQNAFNEKGEIAEAALSKNFDKFVSEFIWFAEAITDKKLK